MPVPPQAKHWEPAWRSVFAGALGLLMALALIKFGNPVVLHDKIAAPTSVSELLIQPWPIRCGYGLLFLVVLLALKVGRWATSAPRWASWLPLAWLGWQILAARHTINGTLTLVTLGQFAACVGCFYLGLLAMSRLMDLRLFWLAVLGAFFVVMIIGWEQHFGGLQRTREYFYQLPDWKTYPPDFLKKIASDRIYSTLFYPNALAGVIILLLPVTLFRLWRAEERRAVFARVGLAASAGTLALGCLYWSGSKSGWLIALCQGLIWFLSSPWNRRAKLVLVVGVLGLGLAGFWIKYRDYFARGATSAVARFDYWRSAWRTLRANPIVGTGPGTFMISYEKTKAPGAEMARLAHNDYLQQGSDSGLPGMVLYAVLVWGSILQLFRNRNRPKDAPAVWLGVAGLGAQSMVEFGLYIPALAWPFFLFLGWLWGRRDDVVTSRPGSLAPT